MRRYLQAAKASVTLVFLKLATKYPHIADIYYCFNSSYRREHVASVHAKLKSLKAERSTYLEDSSMYALRRHIHRLEKGLIMRPQRDVFALEYIEETVALYSGLVQLDGDRNEGHELLLDWAHQVLGEYFDCVKPIEKLVKLKEEFIVYAKLCPQNKGNRKPFKRKQDPLEISYDNLYELAMRRRSVRWYEDKPVPRNLIDKAIEIARQSPSACNRLPYEFRVIDNVELAHEVTSLALGASGFSRNVPCVVALIGKLGALPAEADRHIIYIDASLALMAFLFALEVQGVSTCCINWRDVAEQEEKAKKRLLLKEDERIVVFVSMGFPDPDGMVPYSQKRSLDEIRTYFS